MAAAAPAAAPGDATDAVARDIYRDMYDETVPPARERARAQNSGGPKQLAAAASRRGAAKTISGDRLAREDRLRISEILFSSGYKERGSGGNRDSTWLVFAGRGQTSLAESTKWKGSLPKVDLLHEYTVLYRFETDVYDPAQRVACIKKVLETRRAPLDREILRTILCDIMKMDALEATPILAEVFGEVTKISKMSGEQGKIPPPRRNDDPAANLGAFLRRFGRAKWLLNAEERITYFQDWYAEALVPPYEPDSIKYLRPETISAIARIAIAEPWKLCFWWMSEAPLLEELDRTQAEAIAQKYGGDFPETAKIAVAAYHGRPFADARSRGDSYVPFAWFKDPKNFAPKQKFRDRAYGEDDRLARNPGVLQACLKHRIVRIVKEEISEDVAKASPKTALSADEEAEAEADAELAKITDGGGGENSQKLSILQDSKPREELRVYCVGDMRCETEVAEMIVRAVREPEDGVVKMRPRSSWWPQRELRHEVAHRDSAVDMDKIPPPTPTPNEEQAAAIEAAMHTRLGVVCGKPGTGKTAMVMKVLFSAFVRGQCVGVSFTGMAAHNQHKVAGYGVTAHKIVNEWRKAGSDVTGQREHAFSGRRVLVVEESSAISMRLLHATLVALGPSLRRIYFFGDYRQMPPPDGGPSILEALVRRYANTKIVSELRTSMRVTDATGAFVRNLDRICEHRICEEDGYEENFTRKLEWSADPASKHPFVFLKRGRDAAENVAIVRGALSAAGIDPDSQRAQVMVRTNETRLAMSRAWYEASPIGKKNLADLRTPYAEHEFSVGERIMFLRNQNNEYTPRGSKFKVCKVMNGMSGQIAAIFDEDTENADAAPSQITDTRARKHPRFRRWMRVEPGNVHVALDSYGKNRIARIPPVTIDKMQGLEADYSVVVLVKPVKKLGSRGMYSACSRGRLGCFVVADFDPARKSCPSKDFADTVMASRGILPKTDFWKRFPPREEIEKQIRCDPDECIYYAKNGEQNEVDDSSSSSENSDKADRSSAKCKRPRKNLPRSVVDFALESLLRAAKKPRL